MARRRTFSEWLQQQRHGNDPVADLALDVRHDAGASGATTPEDFLARCPMLPAPAARAAATAVRRYRRQQAQRIRPALLDRAQRVIDLHDLVFGPPSEDPLAVHTPPAGTGTPRAAAKDSNRTSKDGTEDS